MGGEFFALDDVCSHAYASLADGYIEIPDRQGVMAQFPLLTISLGIATTATRTFTHYGEAVAVATEMKQFAKAKTGSAYAIDRRAG